MNKTVYREFEVAFSKHAQPVWFRIVKWILIIAAVSIFYYKEYFWIVFSIFTLAALMVHFLWRYKTKGWTQSWIGWDFEKNKPKGQYPK